MEENSVIYLTTSRPSSALTPTGGGGSIVCLCSKTGSVHSSLRTSADLSGRSASLGISSLSLFPNHFSKSSRLCMAYGENAASRQTKASDTYAMLLSLRSAPSPPILHWKCRLPESPLTAGLNPSPCGNYVVGGGASGTCYVWSALDNGRLLNSFQAHYRALTHILWSQDGRFLVTGGADGMVHLFSLIDIVDGTKSGKKNAKTKKNIAPLQTWSSHHLPVADMVHVSGSHIASVSTDGKMLLLDLISEAVVATIQMPHGARCLAYEQRNNRIFVGSTSGDVYIVDLDGFAMHQSMKQGASGTTSKRRRLLDDSSMSGRIFGSSSEAKNDAVPVYQTELCGHEFPVTSIAILPNVNKIVSGDESGAVRMWDVASRGCIWVASPWSITGGSMPSSNSGSSKADVTKKSPATLKSAQHPVTSMHVVSNQRSTVSASSSLGMFVVPSGKGNASNITHLLQPLQRFFSEDSEDLRLTQVPFLRGVSLSSIPSRDADSDLHSDLTTDVTANPHPVETQSAEADQIRQLQQKLKEQREQMSTLKRDLETEKNNNMRWEKVNNKLMAKLQK